MEQNNDQESFGSSLLSSASGEIKDLTANTAELALDSLMNIGFLKDLPFFEMLFKLVDFGLKFQKTILAKKIVKFLFQLKDVPKNQREKMIRDIENKQHFGEELFMLLDKITKYEQIDLIGKLFKAYILGKITGNEFQYLSHIVSISYTPYLSKLLTDKDFQSSTINEKQHFASIGLANFKIIDHSFIGRLPNLVNQDIQLNEFGEKLLSLDLVSN